MWLNGLKRLWKYPKYSNKYRTKLFSYETKHKNFSPIKFTTNKMAYFDPKKIILKKINVWNVFDNNWLMMQTRLYTKIIQITINCHVKQQCSVFFFSLKCSTCFFSNKNKVSSFCWIGFAWISSCKMNIERICYTFYFDLL